MIFRLLGSLLPTQKNKEEYKREQQLLYIIQNDPEYLESIKKRSIPKDELDALYARLDEAKSSSKNHSFRDFLYRVHGSLYLRITKNWDKGLDALTPERRAELLRDCEMADKRS